MENKAQKWAEEHHLHYEQIFSPYSFWTHEEKILDHIWGEIGERQRIFIFKVLLLRNSIGLPRYKTYFNGRYYFDLQYDLIDRCETKKPEEYEKIGQRLWEEVIYENEAKGPLTKIRGFSTFNKVTIGDRRIALGDVFSGYTNTYFLFPLEVIFGLMGRYYLENGEKLDYKKVRAFYDGVKEFYFARAGLLKKCEWRYTMSRKIVPHHFIQDNEADILKQLCPIFGDRFSRNLLTYYKDLSGQR